MARIETDVLLGQRYRLVDRIASGGMGTVWEAEDTVLHRPVAIKVLAEAFSEDEEFVERFRREARAAAGLTHPDVARVYDYGEDQGTQFIVMELVAGETLADRLARGPLDAEEAVRVAQRVAEALQAAHTAGVIHRDVKPGNIMLTPSGGVKVMDFGIAAAAWDSPITRTGATLGTAFYLSPEQAAGKKATAASDVYSLSVVLYEMLTGRPPFTGKIPIAVAAAHLNAPVPEVRDASPSVPDHVAVACERALSKDPGQRPSSAGAFAAMLRSGGTDTAQLVSALAPVTPPATPPVEPIDREQADTAPVVPWSSRWSWAVPAMLVAIGLVAILIGAIVGGGTDAESDLFGPSPSPPRARTSPVVRKVQVPVVEGMTIDDATRAIEEARLKVRGPTYVLGHTPGLVFDTDPEAGASLRLGSPVTLKVGKARTVNPGGGGDGGTSKEPKRRERGGKGKGNGKGKGGD